MKKLILCFLCFYLLLSENSFGSDKTKKKLKRRPRIEAEVQRIVDSMRIADSIFASTPEAQAMVDSIANAAMSDSINNQYLKESPNEIK